jgi:alkylation response protein AidB-like acyl-CoA dehydrogenase
VTAIATRDDVRRWLAEHPHPDGRALADAGLVAPHWPEPWGLAADEELQLAIAEELAAAGVELPENQIAVGWAGPTILVAGTDEQKARFLPGILDGSEFWCQLFSEPEAGSDLASLRTKAERDGDVYIVNGQKIWSTWANRSDWGILLARTDPRAPKHKGISYFALDMRLPGIEVRKIIEMTGGNHFNEVFLTDVRVPADCLIGPEHGGWALAKVTLANERVSLSEGGVVWGMGPTTDEFMDHVRAGGERVADPHLRQRVASVYAEREILKVLKERSDPSIQKTLSDVHGQRVMSAAKDLRGAAGMLGVQSPDAEHVDVWHWGYLFSRALTIGGGTSEIQRNVIGERLLGLPREPV